MTIRLCPAQQRCYEKLRQLLPLGEVFALSAGTGKGRTTLLRLLHEQTGGTFLNMRDFMAAMRRQDPAALEETFEQMLLDALAGHDQAIVDDLHILTAVVNSQCNYLYPRKGLLEGPLTRLPPVRRPAAEREGWVAAIRLDLAAVLQRAALSGLRLYRAGVGTVLEVEDMTNTAESAVWCHWLQQPIQLRLRLAG